MYTYFRLILILTLMPLCVVAEEAKKPPQWDVNNPPGVKQMVDINTTTGTWMNVDVSPDGQQIVFDLLGDIYTMPITGGAATNLTNSMAWDMQARFSPDGNSLVYTSDQGGGDNIWTMDVDGENQVQVTQER
mgnify:FL=1